MWSSCKGDHMSPKRFKNGMKPSVFKKFARGLRP